MLATEGARPGLVESASNTFRNKWKTVGLHEHNLESQRLFPALNTASKHSCNSPAQSATCRITKKLTTSLIVLCT